MSGLRSVVAATPRVRRPYADIVIWLGLVGVGVALLLLYSSAPGSTGTATIGAALDRLTLLGLRDGVVRTDPGVLAAPVQAVVGSSLALLAGAAGVAVHASGMAVRWSWWTLQAASTLLGAVWTGGLVLALGIRSPGVMGLDLPPLGAATRELSATLSMSSPVGLVLLVGASGGLAVGVLNAGVQSLCGQVQARRFAPVAALSPVAGWSAEGATWLVLLLTVATLTAAAMASERGRGPLWTIGLGGISGALLGLAQLTAYQTVVVGGALLCVFFLRRRPMTILVAGAGLAVVLVVAALAGWSWTVGVGLASAGADLGPLLAGLIAGLVATVALGGPVLVASVAKVRGTPGWPYLLAGIGSLVFALLTGSAATTWPATVAGVLPLLMIAAVAPRRPAGLARGPETASMVVAVVAAIGLSLAVPP